MQKLLSFNSNFNSVLVSGDVTVSQKKIYLKFLWEDSGNILKTPERQVNLGRRHELWKSTCFEAFLKPEGQDSYFELNLTTAGFWNVYAFDSYRMPTPPKEAADFKLVRLLAAENEIEGEFSFSSRWQRFDCGLSAVLETQNSNIEYFALKHLGQNPNFHDAKSFILKRSFL